MIQETFVFTKSFSAAHFYHVPNWSPEKNREIFGKCYSQLQTGHGHDYKLVVEFSQKNDQENSTQMHQKTNLALDSILNDWDHHHLNHDLPYFKGKIPTTENIALVLFEEITQKLFQKNLALNIRRLCLYETPDIWSEITSP